MRGRWRQHVILSWKLQRVEYVPVAGEVQESFVEEVELEGSVSE